MNWWHYLLLVNIYLLLFYGFYALLLRAETFFQLNRVYLVGAAILSFLIPVIQADWVKHLFITQQVQHSLFYSGYAGNIVFYTIKATPQSTITIGQMLLVSYLTGIAFLGGRLAIQLLKLRAIISQPEPNEAYSFFKKISLGQNQAKEDAVMAHEQVHARQWHSADVLLIELVMIISWFNPIVYFYRRAIKHIHEYIADQQALKTGANKKEYALLLLSQTFNTATNQLVNPFYNHSLLKKRITMIQKNRSHRIVLFKYVLSAPLFGLMLILSSATVNNSQPVTAIRTGADKLFNKPAQETFANIDENGKIPDNSPLDKAAITPANTATPDTVTKGPVYVAVDTQPVFGDDPKAFLTFLSKTVRYPALAREKNITGTIYVRFIVETDGSLSDVTAVRPSSDILANEAVRAVKLSPKWHPGLQNKVAVRVEYTVPIHFNLAPDRPFPPHSPQLVAGTDIFESADVEPSFPGGMGVFYNFLAKTIRYPAEDRKNNITGKVFVQFVVEKDGAVTNVKSLRAPSEGLGNEAVRAISLSPNWIPGKMGSNAVRVQYTVPVNFTLNDGTTDLQSQTDKIYEAVDTEPAPVGGMQSFYQFLASEIRYPAEDRKNNITGKAFVVFVVEKDGSLSNIKAIRAPSESIGKEAVRAISLSPKWTAGTQNGKPVRVQYTVPVNFTLNR